MSILDAILKVEDGERNFDVLGARKTFDAYAPGEAPLKLKGRRTATEGAELDPDDSMEAASGGERNKKAAPAAEPDALGSFGVQ